MIKRSDGRYQQAITVTSPDGRRRQKYFYGKTKSEVLRKIADYEEELETGPLYKTVLNEWWNQHEPTLALNTLRGYRPAVARAKSAFGEKPIREIRPIDIARYLSRFCSEYHASAKTAHTQRDILCMSFRYAVSAGYIDTNPASEIEVPKNLPKSRREIASDEDIKTVKASTGLPFGMYAYMLLYTGMRRSELTALTWEDIDMANRTITVNKSVTQNGNDPVLKLPKTEAGIRVLPILDKLYEKLTPGTGLVFPNPDGKLMNYGQVEGSWRHYCRSAGISCTPHQLRHAYATMLFEADVPESDAQELLGHANIQTTKDVYTHIRESHAKKVRESLYHIDIE